MSVVAIIVALAVPSFKEMAVKGKLRGASELVYSQLVFAKTQAIKESDAIRVTFLDAANGAWKFGMSNGANNCDPSDNSPACEITYNGNTEAMLFTSATRLPRPRLAASTMDLG